MYFERAILQKHEPLIIVVPSILIPIPEASIPLVSWLGLVNYCRIYRLTRAGRAENSAMVDVM